MLKKIFIALICLGFVGMGVAYNLSTRPDFTTVEGEKMRWDQLQGQWLVVNYFAEWCAPCLREIPHLNEFYQEQGSSIKLFGASFDNLSIDQLADLKRQYEIAYPVIAEFNQVPPMPRPKSLPATYLIRPDGTVAKLLLGEQDAQSILTAIDAL